jgi:hypothetical protein
MLNRHAVIAVLVVVAFTFTARADTFLWNGNGVTGGVVNDLFNNPSLLNTWTLTNAPSSSTATRPGSLDAAVVNLASGASLSQNANTSLTIGYFKFNAAAPSTLTFAGTNTFFDFLATGQGTLNVISGMTTISNNATIGDGVNPFVFNLFSGASFSAHGGLNLNSVSLTVSGGSLTVGNWNNASGFNYASLFVLGNSVINLTGGTLNVGSYGSLALLGNSNLIVNGGTFESAAYANNTFGLMIGKTASATFKSNTIAPRGIFNTGTLIVDLSGTFSNRYDSTPGASLSVATGRSATISGYMSNGGFITVEKNATFNFNAYGVGASTLYTNGAIVLKGDSVAGPATMYVSLYYGLSNYGSIVALSAPGNLIFDSAISGAVAYNYGTIDLSAGGSLIFQVNPAYAGAAINPAFVNFGTVVAGNGGLAISNNNSRTGMQMGFSNMGWLDVTRGLLQIGGAGSLQPQMSNLGIILLSNAGMTLSSGRTGADPNRIFSNAGVIRHVGSGAASLDFEGNIDATTLRSLNRVVNTGTIESIGGGTFDLTRSQVQATVSPVASGLPANSAFTLTGVYRAGSFSVGTGNNGTINLPPGFLGGTGSIVSIDTNGGIIIEGSLSGIMLSNAGAFGKLRLDTIRTNRGIIQLGNGQDIALGATFTDNFGGKLISTGASISALGLGGVGFTGGTLAPLVAPAWGTLTTYQASNNGTIVLPNNFSVLNGAITNSGQLILTDGGTIVYANGTAIVTLIRSNTGLIMAGGSFTGTSGYQVEFANLGSSSGTIVAGSPYSQGGTLVLSGLVSAGAAVRMQAMQGAILRMTNSQTIIRSGQGVLIQDANSDIMSSDGKFANVLQQVVAGGSLVINNSVNNNWTMAASSIFNTTSFTYTLAGLATTTGFIQAGGTSLSAATVVINLTSVTGPGGLAGTFQAAQGGTLSFPNLVALGTNNVIAAVNGGNVTLGTGFVSNTGRFYGSGGTFNAFGLQTNAGIMWAGVGLNGVTGSVTFILSNTGIAVLNNATTGYIATIGNGYNTLTFVGANIVNAGSIYFYNSGKMAVYSDLAQTIRGSITNLAGGTIAFGNSTPGSISANIFNYGTIDGYGNINGTITGDVTNSGYFGWNPVSAWDARIWVSGNFTNTAAGSILMGNPNSGATNQTFSFQPTTFTPWGQAEAGGGNLLNQGTIIIQGSASALSAANSYQNFMVWGMMTNTGTILVRTPGLGDTPPYPWFSPVWQGGVTQFASTPAC